MQIDQVEKQPTENISIDETTLVRKAQHGDSAAIKCLVIKYQDRVFNVILKICGNRDDAAELTQETFVKVIEKIDTFKGNSAFYTWLFRIATNLTLNFCRRKFKISVHSLDSISGSEFTDARLQLKLYLADNSADDPAVIAQNREICGLLKIAIGNLDENQRAVIVLRDIEGMSYAQVAQTLDIEIGTVKSRLSRARQNLKEILETVL